MESNPFTIVVGVDASSDSELALSWARQVAPADARLVAVHAWELPIVTGYDMVVTVNPDEIEQLATAGLQELLERIGDDRVTPVVHQGHAGRGLVEHADQVDAAMIVVGHRGSGRISMMLGSTANYVLHHTERPVVVCRGEEVGPLRTVVVGVDDHDLGERSDTPESNESVRALQWVYTLPGVDHVSVIHSWFLPALAAGAFSSMAADFDQMDTGATAIADRVVELAGPPPDGLTVATSAVRGTPAFALIEASRSADLVVVGSRGRGGFAGLLLGSTSGDVAAYAHCPAAVIR